MRPASLLRYYYLTWFSQPVADRALYQAARKHTIRSIVEMGIGRGERTKRLIETALKPLHTSDPLRYTGIDLFEARPPQSPGLRLKEAYAQLRCDQVKLQLVPGDPLMALSRMANSLANTDLLIISLDQLGDSLTQAWRFVPRMLHPQTLVYLEQPDKKPGTTKFSRLSVDEIQRLATDANRAVRRAA